MQIAAAANQVQRASVNWAEGLSKVDLTAEQKAQIVRELRERERWFELCDVYRAHIDAKLPPAQKAT